MRIKDDCTYAEYKDGVMGAFHLYECDHSSPEEVTNYWVFEDWTDEMENTTSGFLWFLSIAVREIELGILEERVLYQLSHYMPAYDQGEFNDLTTEEKEMVNKDVEFVKQNAKLIPIDELQLA